MPTTAKLHLGCVIAGGGAVLSLALSQRSSANPIHFLIFLALAGTIFTREQRPALLFSQKDGVA